MKLGKESVFSSQHEGAKRCIKDQFGRNVFAQEQAAMPDVFTTRRSNLDKEAFFTFLHILPKVFLIF